MIGLELFIREYLICFRGIGFALTSSRCRLLAPNAGGGPPSTSVTIWSFNDAAAQLRGIVLNNVRLHLRSDVPLWGSRSGGLDSSSVVCAMRHLEPKMPIHLQLYRTGIHCR